MDSTPDYQALPLNREQNHVTAIPVNRLRHPFVFPSVKQLITLAFAVALTAFFSAYWTRTSFVSKMLGHHSIQTSSVRFRSPSAISKISRPGSKLMSKGLDLKKLRTYGFDYRLAIDNLMKQRFCSVCTSMGYSVGAFVLEITELCTILAEGSYCKVCKSLGFHEPA
uniref:Uncharacterized protein SSH466 n=1 Tax=Gracilariopsis lemaneiformis TaxID=2782 RepID=Q4U1I3_GRALE|nr:hypothetical protein [Gracilariopsis lemaneiformis]